jgi:Protein of unknown function (DUF1778)
MTELDGWFKSNAERSTVVVETRRNHVPRSPTNRDDRREPRLARAVVDRSERIVLSASDTMRVLELLENPPKPTSALVEAAHLHRAQRVD